MDDIWLIFFDDVMVSDKIFMGEGAEVVANLAFDNYQLNWSCHLFKKVK